jgi:lysophospholipase L1-like esterase
MPQSPNGRILPKPGGRKVIMTSDKVVDPGSRADLWQGAPAWQQVDGWWQPWRLLPEEEPSAYAPELFSKARAGAGVRLRTITDADRLTAELELDDPDGCTLDLIIGGESVNRIELAPGRSSLDVELPGRRTLIEVWLPHQGELLLRRPVLHGAEVLEAPSDRRSRWITYGSSITQCRAAEGPSETWPARVARDLDLDLHCLGFGGQCHLDPAVLRTLDTLDADLISLCLGINVHGGSTFSARSWPGQVAEVIRRIRAGHPDIPIAVISPIVCPDRENSPNGAGMTLSEIRGYVEQVATDLRDRGDEQLHLVKGLEIFGPADAELLHDGLHPSHDGYRLMAERLTPVLRGLLPTAAG